MNYPNPKSRGAFGSLRRSSEAMVFGPAVRVCELNQLAAKHRVAHVQGGADGGRQIGNASKRFLFRDTGWATPFSM